MARRGKQNVFEALGFPKHEAAVMLLRAQLAEEIRRWIEREGLTQLGAAEHFGISAPRLNEIVRNRIEKVGRLPARTVRQGRHSGVAEAGRLTAAGAARTAAPALGTTGRACRR
ncbi:MAG TPA: XRE family transcriptional regulator [Pseudomonadota bacterium]|nr:XRE family transcriptional regulator [Pseudomonadota bacterium]